jgi:hypothetical protein
VQEWRSDKGEKFGAGFWVQSVIALALAFAALSAVWDGSPTWGDAGFPTAMLTLVATAVSAAGLRSFIDTVARR